MYKLHWKSEGRWGRIIINVRYKKLCLLVLQSSQQIVPYWPHWKQDSCGQHRARLGAQGMFALPNWIPKILKGYSYYSILSNAINEDLRASSSTNTPKSWSINTKLHCQSTYFLCPRGAEKGGRRLFPRGNPGKALVASGLSHLCPQMGARAPYGRKRSNTCSREWSFSWGLLLARYKPV